MTEDASSRPEWRNIKVSEIKQDVTPSAEALDRFRETEELDSVASQERYAHLLGVRDHYKHKATWSRFLMVSIGFMVLFQSGLIVVVGLEWLDFSSYKWLLPALLVQNFGQVVGLAIYAVRHLFSDISDTSGSKYQSASLTRPASPPSLGEIQ